MGDRIEENKVLVLVSNFTFHTILPPAYFSFDTAEKQLLCTV